jgi:nucleotide-binding universal stress UspA family protein
MPMEKLIFKRILIPTDFSETADLALLHAIDLAKRANAEIILLHVVVSYAFKAGIESKDGDTGPTLRDVVEEKLSLKAKEIKALFDLEISTRVAVGEIRDEVVKAAEESGSDVIVLGTHGVSGIKEFFMGSNAFRIVSESTCPVLSIQAPPQQTGFRHLLVPIDNSFHSREKLNLAIRFAHTYNAQLHICGLRSHDHDDHDLNTRFRLKMQQVEEFVTEHNTAFSMTTIFCSNIAKTTLEYAAEKNADLIIIMNEQEGNTTGFFMGPYAQQIVNHSTIPVLSIPPAS